MVKPFLQKFYIAIILFILYTPIAVLIVLSFNASKSSVAWGGFTFNWYLTMFHNTTIIKAVKNTVSLALLAGLFSSAIGMFAAFCISTMKSKAKALTLGGTNITLLNADIVTGIALMLFFLRFINLGYTTMLIAHTIFCIPYVVLCVLPKIYQVDKNIYNAARDLGASPIRSFFSVILPDIFPGVLTGFLLAVTMSMDDFVITYFTRGPGVNTISTMLYTELKKGINPQFYALSTIMFLIVLLLLFLVNRISSKNEKKLDYR